LNEISLTQVHLL